MPRVIHISGYPRAQLEQEGSVMPGAAYLAKPFTVRQLRDCVAALLGS
jgi:hypothetical protein